MKVNRKPSLMVIFLTIFIDLIGFGIVIPLLPFYALNYSASALEVTLLSTVFSFMQFLLAPYWGSLSDRFGRRPILLMSIIGNVFAYSLFALADSLWMIFLSRILAGGFSANIGAAQAYIADITTPANRAKGMGLVGAAFGLGFIFGPALGGLLSPYGYHVPGWTAAWLCLMNSIFAFYFLPETLSAEQKEKNKLSGKKPSVFSVFKGLSELRQLPNTFYLISLFFMTVFAHSIFESTFALLMDTNMGMTAKEVGYTFTLIGFIIAIVQGGLIGKFSMWIGSKKLVTVGLGLSFIALGFLPFMEKTHLFWVILFISLYAFGNAIFSPSINGMISNSVPADQQGKILGLNQGVASLARIVGPILGGFAFGTIGVPWPFMFASFFMFCAFLLAFGYFYRQQKE